MNNTKLDFPFYKDNPSIKISGVIILTIVPIFFLIYTFIPFNFPNGTGPYIFCFSQLLAFLYVARGKISLIVKKPNFRDIVRVFITLILQYIFAIGLAMILKYLLNIAVNENGIFELEMKWKFWLLIIVQLFGEELFKILIFLATLVVIYKVTKKQKLSIFISVTISLAFFALLHTTTYNNLIQIFMLQGLASIFCFYNYLKTKNILTSYLQHLLFDAIPFILAMMNIIK